jgi:hypothetical protein
VVHSALPEAVTKPSCRSFAWFMVGLVAYAALLTAVTAISD